MPRGVALIVAAVLALAVSACGSASHSSTSTPGALSSVEATELSYIAPGAPFVVSVPTAAKSAAGNSLKSLTGSVPDANLGIEALKAKLSEIGIDYATTVMPLLGNPVLVGAGAPTLSGPAKDDIVAVWTTRSASAVATLLGKVPGLHSGGASYDGATLYALGQKAELAVDGATVVFSESLANVEAALARHAHDAGFSAAEYARLTTGLPAGSLAVVGDLTGELSTAKVAKARQVPWVGAIRGYGVSLGAHSSSVDLGFRIDTSGTTLSTSQLPLAPGAAAPELAGSMPITIGISDVAHSWGFIQAAAQESGSAGFAKFLGDEAKAKSKTGYDLDDLIGQFTGSAIIGSDLHTTIGRVTVSDPATAAKILAALSRDPGDVLQSTVSARSLGGGMYELTQKRGPALTLGIAGSQLVIGKGTVAQLQAFAAAPAAAASGASGSVAFRIALPQLLNQVLHTSDDSPVIQVFAHFLGAITGSAQDTPAALSGSAAMTINSAGLPQAG